MFLQCVADCPWLRIVLSLRALRQVAFAFGCAKDDAGAPAASWVLTLCVYAPVAKRCACAHSRCKAGYPSARVIEGNAARPERN